MPIKSVRWSWVTVAAAVATVVGITSADLGKSACVSPQSLELPCPEQRQKLVAHALKFAALNGESQPTSGLLVATTQRAFNGLFGSQEINSDAKVYIVVLRGNFVGHAASVPSRARLPVGRVLTVAYQTITSEVTGWTLTRTLPGVDQLGPSERIA